MDMRTKISEFKDYKFRCNGNANNKCFYTTHYASFFECFVPIKLLS